MPIWLVIEPVIIFAKFTTPVRLVRITIRQTGYRIVFTSLTLPYRTACSTYEMIWTSRKRVEGGFARWIHMLSSVLGHFAWLYPAFPFLRLLFKVPKLHTLISIGYLCIILLFTRVASCRHGCLGCALYRFQRLTARFLCST